MTSAIRTPLALAVGGLLLLGSAFIMGRCSGSSDATAEAAEAEKRRQAVLVAEMVDSLVGARLEVLRVDTVIRSILTSPSPPRRPDVPPRVVLDTITRDSLVSIIGEQDEHIDTLTARLTLVTAVLDTASQAFGRFRQFSDSTIASQARQIVAMQVVIDHPPKASPIGLGGSCGYGAVFGATVSSGPGCVVGVTYSLSLSSLWPW